MLKDTHASSTAGDESRVLSCEDAETWVLVPGLCMYSAYFYAVVKLELTD